MTDADDATVDTPTATAVLEYLVRSVVEDPDAVSVTPAQLFHAGPIAGWV